MKTILFLCTLILFSTLKASQGQELHDESCLACHIYVHDKDFYTRPDDRKMQNYTALVGQVSRCVAAFNVEWFPDEESTVINYLNQSYYHFQLEAD